jgi:hypothetical protein
VDNGGPTQTRALAAGSAAIDAGGACTATDQRGVARPAGASCDSGAYEFAPPVVTADGATDIGSTAATLRASVLANARPAEVHFEYGKTLSYGAATAAQPVGGTTPVAISAGVTGLESLTTYHFRAVAVSGDGTTRGTDMFFMTSGAPGAVDRDPPGFIGGILLGDSAFAAAARGGSTLAVARRRARVGTTVTFALDEAATVHFTVERVLPGRRAGKRCVKPARRNRRAPKCARYVPSRGSFSVVGDAGPPVRFRFTGRLRNRKLPLGSYRLVAVATDASANQSASKRARFKIVRP